MDEREEYWKDFEESTGEGLVARGMGQWRRFPKDSEGSWGLLILTERSFRFRHLPSDNWLQKLVGEKKASSRDEPVEIVVELERLCSVAIPERGLFQRIFGPMGRYFELEWEEPEAAGRNGDANKGAALRREGFSLIEGEEFWKALSALRPGDAGTEGR